MTVTFGELWEFREHKIGQVEWKCGNLHVIKVGMWYLASFMLVLNTWPPDTKWQSKTLKKTP